MKTFRDLFVFLQSYDKTIFQFLEEKWDGKDKQESLLRLFAILELIPDFIGFNLCDGNFNSGTLIQNPDKKVLMDKSLKDKGDKSDLTLIKGNTIVVTSSKNMKKYGVNDLDIGDINNILTQTYNNYTATWCFVVRDKNILLSIAKNADKTSKILSDIVLNPTTLIFDHMDLSTWYNSFRLRFKNISFDTLIKTNKPSLSLKYHQSIHVEETLEKFKNHQNILWGQIPRSGKSYITAGVIEQEQMNNALLITTAPNETIEQHVKIYKEYLQFDGYTVNILEGSKTVKLGEKNIIICSKQYLQSKIETPIEWLKNMKFDMRFVDESHNGGTTSLALQILDTYGF